MNDTETTQILRRELERRGYMASESYEWYQGEPLYHGDPITARATPAEAEAFDAVWHMLNEKADKITTRYVLPRFI